VPDGLILPPGVFLSGGRRELLSPALDPINRTLLGFWPMQEPGGVTVDDISPYRTRGVAVNDPPSVAGPGFRARTFINNGGSGTRRINLGANRPWSALQIPMTIAAWVRPTSNVNGTIFSQYNQFDFDGRFGKWLGITSGGQVKAIIGKSVHNYYQFFNGPTYTLNRWALMAWVLSGTTAAPALRIFYGTTSTSHTPVALGSVDASVETWIGSSVLASTYPSDEGFAGDIGPVRLWGRSLAQDEMSRLARDPWAGTFDPAERMWVPVRAVAGGAPVEATPGPGAITLAGQGVAVAAGAAAAPGAGSVALAGQAVAAVAGAAAQPGAGALVLAGQAATVAAGASVAAGAGAVTLAGQAASVVAGAAASPGAGTLAFAGQPAAVVAGMVAQPGAGALSLAGMAVTVLAPAPSSVPASRTIALPARSRTRALAARDRTIVLPGERA
jgi:hypothetical protein